MYLISEFYLLAACAALLIAPRRPWPLAVGAFWLAFPIAELPFLALAWSTATTLAVLFTAPAGGALATTALAASGLVTALLTVMIAQAAHTPAAVTRALTYAGMPSRVRIRAPWRQAILAPIPRRGRTVARRRGLPYGPDPAHLLDTYLPAHGRAHGPVLVYLHGGSYSGGRRSREALPLLHLLARRGWTCVSADYRLRPAAGLAAHLADTARILAWVHAHHPEKPVFLAGSSAGAHLAALTALQRKPPVAGVVCLYGFYGRYFGDIADDWTAPTSPLEADLADAPPFFLAHGDRDTVVPATEARRFASAHTRASRHGAVHVALPGAQHGFDVFRSLRFGALIEGVAEFLSQVAARDPHHHFDDRKV
ncbi:alpha/beta hydrolase [Phytomonospora endophytica]|uniref:alpha/beta hydrolase n=1 Tax=Phytomonospora endophytica TaxID=714109 RepID=UPI001EF31173|nr:alpha/beta hydrolase [Phytomonospora endophytica]